MNLLNKPKIEKIKNAVIISLIVLWVISSIVFFLTHSPNIIWFFIMSCFCLINIINLL
jgi:hypothetical protein